MKKHPWIILAASNALLLAGVAFGDVKIAVAHNAADKATPAFKFDNVPAPEKVNAASKAKFRITSGEQDENGAAADALHDGKLPTEADQPTSNFFFSQGSKGGQFEIDLGAEIDIKQINTYSWHTDTRAPQVYKVSASNDPKGEWKKLADVDTRPKSGDVGGQYGVSIADTGGSLGKYRYLRFDVASTESDDPFGNTFFSEIDVIDKNELVGATADAKKLPPSVFMVADPPCEITIDTSGAPDLKEWVDTKLGPTLVEWYPKIVKMLPSEGYEPPTKFTVQIRPGSGVAATGNTRITANSTWLKTQLKGEAVGALVHEEVHVVQQYGYGRTVFARRRGGATTRPAGATAPAARPRGTGNPTWLVEGIADYVRWWYYEPDSPRRYPGKTARVRAARGRGAASRPASQPAVTERPTRYDEAYTVSANFLMYVSRKYDKDIVVEMNAAMREARYDPELWKKYTGKTVEDLGAEWAAQLPDRGGKPPTPKT